MWPALNLIDLKLTEPFENPGFSGKKGPLKGFVFFDVGSVLIDLDWDSFWGSLANLCQNPKSFDLQLFLQEARTSKLAYRWSIGRIGPADYADLFIKCIEAASGNQKSPATALDVKAVTSLIVGPMRSRSLRLVKKLRAMNYGVGVLSNATPWHEGDIESTISLRDNFDVVIFSQDVGCEKPEKQIYEIAEHEACRFVKRKFGYTLSTNEIYFVDDTPANVHAANNRGWNARLVCLVKDKILDGVGTGHVKEDNLLSLSAKSENLLFGDAAAHRVERLFCNFE